MIVTCENCGSSFNLKDSLVKPNGRKVRCSKCKTVFFVPPPAEESDEETIDLAVETEDFSSPEDKPSSKEESSSFPPEETHTSFDDTENRPPEETENPDVPKDEEIGEIRTADPLDRPEHTHPTENSENSLDNLDLELELDLDMDEPETSQPVENRETDKNNLDFDLDLELDTDIMEDDDESTPQGKETDDSQPQDDFDFSKIEALLELEEETPDQETGKTSAQEQDFEEEFKLDLDPDSKESVTKEAGGYDNEEIELDFDLEIDDDETVDDSFVKPEEDTIESIIQANLDDSGIKNKEPLDTDNTDDTTFEEPEATVPAKKRILTAIVVSLVLVLFSGGGYFLFRGIANGNIQLPFISSKTRPAAAKDQGDKIIPLNDSIGYDFVNNTTAGDLLVITGKVQNTSSTPQRFVKVTGTLITQGGNKSNITKTVYCGTVFSDIELANGDIAELNRRLLKNQSGDNQSNTRIEPGGEIPFTIVFSNLPDNLETFELKVADYLPAEG
jgi:predicted Zn finger-like uncharacterized protein